MKNERLFKIVYLLIQRKLLTAPELAAELDVSIRTIYRDIDALSASGIPVYSLPGKGGGIAIMDRYKLDRTILTEEEQEMILLSLQNMQISKVNSNALILKLSSLFQKDNYHWMEVDFSRWGYEDSDTQKFRQLKDAILSHSVLRIRYFGSSGEETQRVIYPLQLVYKSRGWYLWSFCKDKDDYRIFKVNRILCLEVLEEQFDGNEFKKNTSFQGEGPVDKITVKLKFQHAAGFRVYDEFGLDMISTNERGEYIVSTDVPMDDWIYGYILSFGTRVEVLSPVEVREKVKEISAGISEMYRGGKRQ